MNRSPYDIVPSRFYTWVADVDSWTHETTVPVPAFFKRFMCDLYDLTLGMPARGLAREEWHRYLHSLPHDPNPASRWRA